MTALDEIRPNAGDFVQAIVIRARPGVQYPCHVVGETERVTKSGHSSMGLKTTEEHFITEYQRGITNKHLTDLFMDSFFAAWFRERVDEPLDYKKTAIYSSLIHGLGSGWIYPSVMSAGAVNIAIPATDLDKYFEVFFTTLYWESGCYGFGVNLTTTKKYSSEFREDGTIVWTSTDRDITTQELHRRDANNRFGAEQGWRVPALPTAA